MSLINFNPAKKSVPPSRTKTNSSYSFWYCPIIALSTSPCCLNQFAKKNFKLSCWSTTSPGWPPMHRRSFILWLLPRDFCLRSPWRRSKARRQAAFQWPEMRVPRTKVLEGRRLLLSSPESERHCV